MANDTDAVSALVEAILLQADEAAANQTNRIIADYVRNRAAQLVAELDAWEALPLAERTQLPARQLAEWMGHARAILREVARDA